MKAYKTYFNWSSGKDSALALFRLLQDKRYSVEYLLTVVNRHHNRVTMHGLRTELLQQQVKSIGIPSGIIELPEQPRNSEYESIMTQKLVEWKSAGFTHSAFGDIFLGDLRSYREHQLEALDLKSVFPLWKIDTVQLMHEFIDRGFKAITVSVNAELLDQSFAGRLIDYNFLNDLPANIDPCGENGEFHTFCFDGPIFKNPVPFSVSDTVLRKYNNQGVESGFWFCDLFM